MELREAHLSQLVQSLLEPVLLDQGDLDAADLPQQLLLLLEEQVQPLLQDETSVICPHLGPEWVSRTFSGSFSSSAVGLVLLAL